MLRVRKKQMQTPLLSDAAFAEWYVEDFMKQNLPQQYYSVSDQGKREMTVNGRIWARRHGFTDAEAQAHFITLMWKVGANFFTHPGFAQIAQDSNTGDMARIEAFYAVPREQAATALMNPDDQYWYPDAPDGPGAG